MIGAGGLIGASFSGFILKIVSSKILMVIFALLVVYSMIQFVLKPKKDLIADTKRYHLQGLKYFNWCAHRVFCYHFRDWWGDAHGAFDALFFRV